MARPTKPRRGDDARQLGFEFAAPPPPPPAAALPTVASALQLDANVALFASAGTGKTHSLVTMCLHLLGGARASGPVAPERLCLLTFTDKAAGEMRHRLRARLDALAEDRAEEPELRAACAQHGLKFPSPSFWRRTRDGLSTATIGTFHAVCVQVLQRARGDGVGPLEVLDERGAQALVRQLVEREVLLRLEQSSPLMGDLVRDMQLGTRRTPGLVDHLCRVFAQVREEGTPPRLLRVTDPTQARLDFDRALHEARAAADEGLKQLEGLSSKTHDAARAFAGGLQATSFERYPSDAQELVRLSGQLGKSRVDELLVARGFVGPVKGVRGPRCLDALHAAVTVAPYEAELRDVLDVVTTAHRQAMADEGAIDFTELTLAARALLRDDAEARHEAQRRIGALLVDEFQDTNRVQREVVLLLSEQRKGGPRPITATLDEASAEVLRLPVEPAFLAVVGDQKQSIYEFRGADVAVFEEMAKHLEASGGRRAWLTTTWRSAPALTRVVNALTRRVLSNEAFGQPRLPFEVVADVHDALEPARTSGPDVALVRLEPALPEKPDVETLRALDAEAVASELAARIADGTVQPRQVAMLFQRLTKLEVYRQALVRFGVRHRVLRGRGFFGAREVVDVAYTLRLLARPDDAFAGAVVLRSPAVCLSDPTLARLAHELDGLKSRPLCFDPPPTWLDGEEAERLRAFQRVFQGLHRQRGRLGVADVVTVWLDELQVRERLAASPFGEQALGNLEGLVELSGARQAAGVDLSAFADELIESSKREPRESPADLIDAIHEDAVTVCTVHQAKGLEWPVVVLPELFSRPPVERDPIRFERNEGLALRPFQFDNDFDVAARQQAIAALRTRRATAENMRLLYVAMTRARDQLVLGVVPPPTGAGKGTPTWATMLHHALWNDLEPSQRRVTTLAGQSLIAPEASASGAAVEAEVAALVRRALEPKPAVVREALLPVTHLHEFSTCGRRFHFAYQVGLPESEELDALRAADVDASTSESEGDVRARGTAAHRLLELTPLDLVGSARLEVELQAIAKREGLDAHDAQLVRWVRQFWQSAAGRRIAALGAARVLRELPFVLPLRDEKAGFTLQLRGQIDLLVEGPDGLEVIDYKTSVPGLLGLEPYRFQLECYALAARASFADARPIRAGIAFLKHDDPSPQFLPELTAESATREKLLRLGKEMMVAQATQQWAHLPEERCRALGCGYVFRCHPRAQPSSAG